MKTMVLQYIVGKLFVAIWCVGIFNG